MKKRITTSLITIGISLLFNIAYANLPDDYQQLAADQKQIVLWEQVVSSHQQNPLPDIVDNSFWRVLKVVKGLFSLKPSFDHKSDEMPNKRIKIIHANGSVGKIRLVTNGDHPFTGLYQSGAIGLARLSVATTPQDDSFVPGMALKFLIPQQASVNLHVMNDLEGQGSNWNYFAKDFSNHVEHPSSWTLKALEKIFEWTKKPANELNVNHLAQWDNLGHPIDSTTSPEQLIFKPSEAIAHLIDENSRQDFRVSFQVIPYGPLYEVYGIYQGLEYHIGTLYLESELLASDYGDKELFFQHQR